MRRKDKQIIDHNETEMILKEGKVLHIAMLDGDKPYLIPVNYGYQNNTIYIHCAKEGKKIELLKKNNLICFQTEIDVSVVNAEIAYKCGTLYKSVLGYGRAYFIDNVQEKKQAADVLVDQYLDKKGAKHTYGKCLKEVCIIKIEIDSISGKESLGKHLD